MSVVDFAAFRTAREEKRAAVRAARQRASDADLEACAKRFVAEHVEMICARFGYDKNKLLRELEK